MTAIADELRAALNELASAIFEAGLNGAVMEPYLRARRVLANVELEREERRLEVERASNRVWHEGDDGDGKDQRR